MPDKQQQAGGTEELAEVLGLKQRTMTVNGGRDTITLRPLSLRQQVEMARQTFDSEQASVLWALHQSATRGGFEGTQDEFGDLLEGDEILLAAEEFAKLSPLSMKAGQAVLNGPPDVETGTESSGD